MKENATKTKHKQVAKNELVFWGENSAKIKTKVNPFPLQSTAVTAALCNTALLVLPAERSPEEVKNSVSFQHLDAGQNQYIEHIMNNEDFNLSHYPFPG